MQREESPTMTTGLERIAAKARCEPKLRFTSLAHHITKERVWEKSKSDPDRLSPWDRRADGTGGEGEL